MTDWGFGFSFDMELEKPLDFFDVVYKNGVKVRYEKRPHGEWENCGGIFCARCSVCKEVAYETAGNFCPNCGADMREGDAE